MALSRGEDLALAQGLSSSTTITEGAFQACSHASRMSPHCAT